MERLYVVTRRDLEPGAICAQSGHALSAFAVAYPTLHRDWHLNGKNLIVLAAKDEHELSMLLAEFSVMGLPVASFCEPDFNDELTSIAVSGAAAKRLSSLPKALREPRCPDCKKPAYVSICSNCA